jgi:SAM-dependent methyltransferase
MNRKAHWDEVHRTRSPREVSWYQREATTSLSLIRQVAPDHGAAILDAGGGASTLVDGLLDAGYRRLTVLDVSASAMAHARARLGSRSESVVWLEGDVLSVDLSPATVDVWHDRAVFHFLTDAADRRQYLAQATRAVRDGGHAIVATFAHDGPEKCSGLSVVRYTPDRLSEEFRPSFDMIDSVREMHTTPAGVEQAFVYGVLRRRARQTPVVVQ